MTTLATEAYERARCPECHGHLVIQDSESGDIVCGSCGYVITERTESIGREWRTFGEEESVTRERTGAPLSLRKPDLGLATVIGKRKGAEKLRFWEKRTLYTRRQRSLRKGLSLIDKFASKLNLGNVAKDQAAYIFRKALNAKFLRGRSIESVAAAAVYSACREHGITRSLDDVAEVVEIDRKELSRCYRNLLELFAIKMPELQPEKYVPVLASEVGIDERISRKAYTLLRRARHNGLMAGLDPRGLAAGALYISGLSEEKHAIQDKLAIAAGVSSFTLRKRAHLLQKYLIEEELAVPVSSRESS